MGWDPRQEVDEELYEGREEYEGLLTVSRVEVWSGPSAFSFPASARWHIRSASPSLPWSAYSSPRLLTVSRVEVWSGPSAFSFPASAHRSIRSASASFAGALNVNTPLRVFAISKPAQSRRALLPSGIRVNFERDSGKVFSSHGK